MYRFKFKNTNIRYFILIICFLIFIYIYFILLLNTNIIFNIIDRMNHKYELDTNYVYKDFINLVKINDYKKISEIKFVNKEIIYENEDKNIVIAPIVYIYNTHDTEKYYLPFISDYSITPSVKTASLILKDYLNDYGIESVIQTKSINNYLKKNNLDYKGCYEASRHYMLSEMKKYNFKILLDIHRDSVKRKYTLYEKDDKRYAKIMFVLTTKHKNYKKNEKFANYLNNYFNSKYKGLSRGIMKRKDVIFNQDLSNNAILIELGGIDNTIEEINNTLKVLSIALKDYIKENNL